MDPCHAVQELLYDKQKLLDNGAPFTKIVCIAPSDCTCSGSCARAALSGASALCRCWAASLLLAAALDLTPSWMVNA